MEKEPNSLLQQLSRLLVPKVPQQSGGAANVVTNERILGELADCFKTSLLAESVGHSLLFNTSYFVILHPKTYEERLPALPVIVDEAVRRFYELLRKRKGPEDKIMPVASHWYFKFGPGTEFNGRLIGREDIEVVGSLAGVSLAEPAQPEAFSAASVKATVRVKNTNMFDKLDINQLAFQHIDFREAGTFAIKFNPELAGEDKPLILPSAPPVAAPKPVHPSALARIDCYMADTNTEKTYWVEEREMVVARKDPDNETFPNYLRLDSPYVSNPHARIRYNEDDGRFQMVSYSRNETRVNEQVIERSEPASPQWVDLPDRAQILLNGVVTLTIHYNPKG
ncbi:hypothetical protein GCM10023189_59190 [Nibrella saemangeumensis]|uniref:FHA domain-containing protein n=1 Tax=Nibrella saemangeumensis TaxID=1084526 RepID=A0ABP8NPG9_9BACT